jgi:hypothetical protein
VEGNLTKASYGDEIARLGPDLFNIDGLADEIRADQSCVQLLKIFCRALIDEEGLAPLEAGALANGADYFLREFLIAERRENIFAIAPGRIRQFAGNWYIIRNLEPNLAELSAILQGVEAFYSFCQTIGRVPPAVVEQTRGECHELDFYRERIESFWAIEGDGYLAWEGRCSLKG